MSNTKKVRILAETHEHGDQRVSKGAELELDAPTADHFVAIGAAEHITGPAAARKTRGAGDEGEE